jgi:hypothetical protein
VQAIKLPWYLVAKLQAQKQAEVGAAAAAAGVKVGMLRVVNAHDVVPNAPVTLPLPGLL